MNAGIIAAFKRRFWRYHLQHVLGCNERGKIGSNQKVDRIPAIRWSLSVSTEILASTNKSYFNHTGLNAKNSTLSIPRKEVENRASEKNT